MRWGKSEITRWDLETGCNEYGVSRGRDDESSLICDADREVVIGENIIDGRVDQSFGQTGFFDVFLLDGASKPNLYHAQRLALALRECYRIIFLPRHIDGRAYPTC